MIESLTHISETPPQPELQVREWASIPKLEGYAAKNLNLIISEGRMLPFFRYRFGLDPKRLFPREVTELSRLE